MKSLLLNGSLILAALITAAAAPEIMPRQASQLMLGLSVLLLVVGLPIGALHWFGRVTERGRWSGQPADAGLWHRAFEEAEAELGRDGEPTHPAPASPHARGGIAYGAPTWVVALMCLVGLAGCSHAPAADWPDIEKGMMTTDVIAMLGPPQHVQTNGNIEAWKYCRDFYGYFADRSVVVWMNRGQVSSVQYHRNLSDGSCEDFFRTAQ